MDIRRAISGGSFCGSAIAKAIRSGHLQPPVAFPCADCGGRATEYDHRDYNEPLNVSPVCRGCNARRGKAIPRRWDDAELFAYLKRVADRQRIVPWAREWCIERIEWLCVRIERATSGAVTRYDLRPDIFGPAERAA